MLDRGNVFDFMDYRAYLKNVYEINKKRNRMFSFRYIAQRVGAEPSFLVRLFQGTLHCNDDAIARWINFLGLTNKEASYFETLVRFCKTKSEIEREACFKKLISLRDFQAMPLPKEQGGLFSRWYHTPIRSLLTIPGISKTPQAIAKILVPNITEQEAAESIELLVSLGLVIRTAEHTYCLPSDFVGPGNDIPKQVVRDYQRAMIVLAEQALDQIPPAYRDISTVSVMLDPQDIPVIQEQISQFRQAIMEFSRESKNPTTMFQLNIQLFPITKYPNPKHTHSTQV